MLKSRRVINIAAQLCSQVVAAMLSLFVTAYVVEHIGEDVYGFVGLANNFVSYASIAAVALNSMASRFIAMEQYKGNEKKAQEYYSTTFFSDVLFAVVCVLIGTAIIAKMDILFDVPKLHLSEIQLLWLLIFSAFVVELISTVFRVSTFVTNKIYLSSLATMGGVIIRAVIVISLLYFAGCRIWFVGLGTLLSMIIQFCLHFAFSMRLTPQYHISWKKFSFHSLADILCSGLWNTVTQLGKMLSEGLDLIIANITISAQAMGVLSVSKVLSTYVQTFTGSVANTLLPQLTYLFSKNELEQYRKQLYRDMDLLSFMACFALVSLYTMGDIFYTLWVPSQSAKQLMFLTFLGSFWMIVSGVIGSIFNAFTVQNRLRYNSILMLVSGVVSTLILVIVLRTTNLGIYAVAGISSLVYILKNIFLIIPYAEKHVGISRKLVYRKIIINAFMVALLVSVERLAIRNFAIHNWLQFICCCTCVAIVTLVVLFFSLISREQRLSILIRIRKGK